MDKLRGLQPERVMYYFEAISRIPRESGNEQAVSDYIKRIGEKLGFETIQDANNNVIIKKPASPGKAGADPVILQGHMDMVCAKKKDNIIDFNKDPIDLIVDGDFITADGTTLGADNGIAVAMTLALLEDTEAVHPSIEALFTTEEETGMDGAINVDGKHFKGKTLINIDSEEEGIFTVSCAGGVRILFRQPYTKVKNPYNRSYEIEISGLTGGHSGIEIHEGRANSIKLLGRVLNKIKHIAGISSLEGGEKMNAIAKRAKAVVSVNEDISQTIHQIEQIFNDEFRVTDPALKITVTECEKQELVMNQTSMMNLINAMLLLPCGVQTMSKDIQGLVESSNNVGVLYTNDDVVILESAARSSVKTRKDEIVDRFYAVGELTGAQVELQSEYPSWPYNPESKIRETMKQVYEKMYGRQPEIMAIHAGLETGILSERIGKIDMISMGPNMWHVHTPNEKLSISSTERTFAFLKEVLKAM
nr:aminoacyl-histidine dipeptidase [uncultured Desulfobacter sp.]